MPGKEEDKIQKITKLLERGGTMLATHHECGAPMFRYQGKTVCPVCDLPEKEVKKVNERKEIEQAPQTAIKKPPAQIKQTGGNQVISSIIMNKIQEIATTLEAETDLQRVKNKMECIEQGIKILKILQE